MPRIAVRTTPYSNVARCTRHYKAKRDLILRALGKATFINGSQFVVGWISPKGEVDVFASELLQDFTSHNCKDGVLDRSALEAHAGRIRQENDKRWADLARLEVLNPSKKGKAEGAEVAAAAAGKDLDGEDEGMLSAEEQDLDDADEDFDETDADRTLVDEEGSSPPQRAGGKPARKAAPAAAGGPESMMSTFAATPALKRVASSSQVMLDGPTPEQAKAMSEMHAFRLKPEEMANYYQTRFTMLQQDVCKLIVKAWIKVIEPKKQNKYPYNKGESFRPDWWPEGVRHREPDHLHKQERLTILSTIIRSDKVDVAKLELSTAECCALIPQSRHATLRELYAVAKEEQRLRQTTPGWELLTVHLPEPSTRADSAEQSNVLHSEHKRTHAQMSYASTQDENSGLGAMSSSSYSNGKRSRHVGGHGGAGRPLGQVSTNVGYASSYSSPFTTAPQTFAGRNDMASAPQYAHHPQLQVTQAQQAAQAHQQLLASHGMYAHDQYAAGAQQQDYRSPNPDENTGRFPHHLAPILGHSQSHSSQGGPNGAHSPMISPQPYSSDPYYATGGARGYMHQQQLDFMQQQQQQQQQHGQQPSQGFYDSPYVGGAQDQWGQGFGTAAAN